MEASKLAILEARLVQLADLSKHIDNLPNLVADGRVFAYGSYPITLTDDQKAQITSDREAMIERVDALVTNLETELGLSGEPLPELEKATLADVREFVRRQVLGEVREKLVPVEKNGVLDYEDVDEAKLAGYVATLRKKGMEQLELLRVRQAVEERQAGRP